MSDMLADPQIWASFTTLTLMEVVLGVDNLLLVAVLAEKLPEAQRARARRIGLLAALGTRLLLLFSITAVMGLTAPVLHSPWNSFSWRDLILVGGGLFLVWKGTAEIHSRIEGEPPERSRGTASFARVVLQIALLDIVFSLDSVITAVGMANNVGVMVAAIVVAIGIMMAAAEPVARFIAQHPTVKLLALSFLLLIGMTLVADGFGTHVPKGYIYAAMGFSVLVEILNQVVGRRRRGAATAARAAPTLPPTPFRRVERTPNRWRPR